MHGSIGVDPLALRCDQWLLPGSIHGDDGHWSPVLSMVTSAAARLPGRLTGRHPGFGDAGRRLGMLCSRTGGDAGHGSTPMPLGRSWCCFPWLCAGVNKPARRLAAVLQPPEGGPRRYRIPAGTSGIVRMSDIP